MEYSMPAGQMLKFQKRHKTTIPCHCNLHIKLIYECKKKKALRKLVHRQEVESQCCVELEEKIGRHRLNSISFLKTT